VEGVTVISEKKFKVEKAAAYLRGITACRIAAYEILEEELAGADDELDSVLGAVAVAKHRIGTLLPKDFPELNGETE
jgi:hypothetical protein